MDALQVTPQPADIHGMDRDYQQMGSEERQRHHDELREDGYQWCPECGGALVWELPEPPAAPARSDSLPVISGDCPPLTAEQLLATIPLS
jgi:hypothetical protein